MQQLNILSSSLNIEKEILHNTLMKTILPISINSEQFVTFLSISNQYNLNPLTREIYAFSGRGGSIQVVVSIDGWIKIINSHPQFDGMQFLDILDNKNHLIAIKCTIFRKDRSHATEVTEYLAECKQERSVAWKDFPARMLRHKAAIQCARYAFGFSGICDPDEAERIKKSIKKEVLVNKEASVTISAEEYVNEQDMEMIRKLINEAEETEESICIQGRIKQLKDLKKNRVSALKILLESQIREKEKQKKYEEETYSFSYEENNQDESTEN